MVAVCAVRVWIIFVWTVHASVEGWTGARVASWVPSKKPVQHSWVPDSLRRIGIEDRTLGMLGLLALLSAAALLHADVKAASGTRSGGIVPEAKYGGELQVGAGSSRELVALSCSTLSPNACRESLIPTVVRTRLAVPFLKRTIYTIATTGD